MSNIITPNAVPYFCHCGGQGCGLCGGTGINVKRRTLQDYYDMWKSEQSKIPFNKWFLDIDVIHTYCKINDELIRNLEANSVYYK